MYIYPCNAGPQGMRNVFEEAAKIVLNLEVPKGRSNPFYNITTGLARKEKQDK